MLKTANQKLDILRQNIPNAGGLIVASSFVHARKIHAILASNLSENAVIATYQEVNPAAIIRRYKHSSHKWIISVGMISEGTDIPRLQVCCHLSRVKTELYFRQVLGRILRASGKQGEVGYIYMPAEPSLVEYAYRVAEDVPFESNVMFDTLKQYNEPISKYRLFAPPTDQPKIECDNFEISFSALPQGDPNGSILSSYYETTLGVFGRFKEDVFSLGVD